MGNKENELAEWRKDSRVKMGCYKESGLKSGQSGRTTAGNLPSSFSDAQQGLEKCVVAWRERKSVLTLYLSCSLLHLSD